jgi:hypothetical protein
VRVEPGLAALPWLRRLAIRQQAQGARIQAVQRIAGMRCQQRVRSIEIGGNQAQGGVQGEAGVVRMEPAPLRQGAVLEIAQIQHRSGACQRQVMPSLLRREIPGFDEQRDRRLVFAAHPLRARPLQRGRSIGVGAMGLAQALQPLASCAIELFRRECHGKGGCGGGGIIFVAWR